MGTVWVVEGGWDYDGDEIVGIFISEEKAKNVKEEAEKKKRYDWVDYNEYCVIE